MIHIIYTFLHIIWSISYIICSIWYGPYHMDKLILLISSNGTLSKDYIEFRHGNSCHSLAGRDGKRQDIVLSPLCAEEHTLIHEVISVCSKIVTLKIISDSSCPWSVTWTSATRPGSIYRCWYGSRRQNRCIETVSKGWFSWGSNHKFFSWIWIEQLKCFK